MAVNKNREEWERFVGENESGRRETAAPVSIKNERDDFGDVRVAGSVKTAKKTLRLFSEDVVPLPEIAVTSGGVKSFLKGWP